MATRLLIKEMAEFRNISKRKLMFASQVDMKTLQRIWKDPYTTVTTETLDKIAKALEVDVSLLVESDPPLPITWEDVKGIRRDHTKDHNRSTIPPVEKLPEKHQE